MDRKEESSSNEEDVMEAMVIALAEESDLNFDLEECVNKGVDECNLTKSFPCGLCSIKVCKSKGGVTLHTKAKHGEKTVVTKSVCH